uniref:Uncharacterized protein n=1 Tax=Arundo donax TaxID=35708 RepID=A0A0A9BKY3_ARUDO
MHLLHIGGSHCSHHNILSIVGFIKYTDILK